MVSINLSDFFHDILITQAFRPVSRYRDQWVPSLSAGPLKGLEQKKSPPGAPLEKGNVWVNGSYSVRKLNANRFNEQQADQWGIPDVSMEVERVWSAFLVPFHADEL